MNGKLQTLREAVRSIENGSTVALGGNVMHRSPLGAVAEMIVQGKRDLHLVKTAGAHDVDLLCAFDLVKAVTFGFISYEPPFGLCRYFRKAVEEGKVQARENACYTVIMALRAAAYGLGFIPTKGLNRSDLIKSNGFKMVSNPYSGEEYVALPALEPDFAIIHVQEADIYGNSKIIGPKYEDQIMVRAAKRVIVTAERIVETSVFRANPDYADIPGNLVSSVVKLPGGAHPGTCAGLYDQNNDLLDSFQNISTKEALEEYVERLRKIIGLSDKGEACQ